MVGLLINHQTLFSGLRRGDERVAHGHVVAGEGAGEPDAADGEQGGDGGVFVVGQRPFRIIPRKKRLRQIF